MKSGVLMVFAAVFSQIMIHEGVQGTCPSRPDPAKGYITYTKGSEVNGQYSVGTVAETRCSIKYFPSGETRSNCRNDGWSHPPITCDETCAPTTSPIKGCISYDRYDWGRRYPMGTVGSFTCNEGYLLVSGAKNTTCMKQDTVTGWVHSGDPTNCTKFCFPSTAKVKLENDKSIMMSELQIGDRVQTVSSTGSMTYSEVRTFLMKQTSVISMYKSISSSTNDTITLSDTHLIYARKNNGDRFYPIHAYNVVTGDEVLVKGNDKLTVVKVIKTENVKMQGAYVPLTKDSNLIVDGVLSSCYASFNHDLSHFVMMPFQWFPNIIEWIFGDNNGSSGYVDIAKELGRRILPFGLL